MVDEEGVGELWLELCVVERAPEQCLLGVSRNREVIGSLKAKTQRLTMLAGGI